MYLRFFTCNIYVDKLLVATVKTLETTTDVTINHIVSE